MEHYRNCNEQRRYDVENAELSMRLYDNELTENIELDMDRDNTVTHDNESQSVRVHNELSDED